MKTVSIIAKSLFVLTRIISIAYFTAAALSLFSFLTKSNLILLEGEKYFKVCYPFTDHPFLGGDYNSNYIIFDFLLPITMYGLFFLLISNVFNVFTQARLFTEYSIKHLKRFYLANIFVPISCVLLISIFGEVESPAEVMVILHFLLGIFAFFLAAIFRQGLKLQNDQDLII